MAGGEDQPDSHTRSSKSNTCRRLPRHVCLKLGAEQANRDGDAGNSTTEDHTTRTKSEYSRKFPESDSPVFYPNMPEHAGSMKPRSELHRDIFQDNQDHRVFFPIIPTLPPSSSPTKSKLTQKSGPEADRQSNKLNSLTFKQTNLAEEMFTTPAPKMFTPIVARDEVDGTPANDTRSLSQMYKDVMAEEDSGYGSPAPFPGRPCRVGREKMDIVAELRWNYPVLLDKIISNLSASDIVRFSCVCKEWRNVIKSNRIGASKKSHFLRQKAKQKKKENYPRRSFQRATVSASTPLGEVQRVGEPQASSTPVPRLGNHDKFYKASESLLKDESLTKCVRGACQSPAKLLMNGQRAQCTRCGYDFCTDCHCEFHASSVCPALREKNTAKRANGIGSGKSKRSLRRIDRLESYP